MHSIRSSLAAAGVSQGRHESSDEQSQVAYPRSLHDAANCHACQVMAEQIKTTSVSTPEQPAYSHLTFHMRELAEAVQQIDAWIKGAHDSQQFTVLGAWHYARYILELHFGAIPAGEGE